MPRKDPEARNAYMRDYHARRPEKQRARVAARNARLRLENAELIRSAKARPCADCGGTFPACVMDFDHVRGKKMFTIGDHGHLRVSPSRVREEILKCEVVCANCHRIRTHS